MSARKDKGTPRRKAGGDPWARITENVLGERRTNRDSFAECATINIDGAANLLARLHDSSQWQKVTGYRRAELRAAYRRLQRIMRDLELPPVTSGNVVKFPGGRP